MLFEDCPHMGGLPDMRKGADTLCRNFMLGSLNISLIRFLMLKYHGTFTYIAQYSYSNADLIIIKGIFSYKPSIIVEV